MELRLDTHYEVVQVPVNDIQVAPYNPESRTNTKNMAQLERDIIEAGGILVPLALTCDGKLADGHRRLRIAKRLGMPTVPCIYYPTSDPKRLWSLLSLGSKPITPRDWMEAYHKGLGLANLPPRYQTLLAALKRILNDKEYDQFVEKKRNPGMLNNVYTIANYCKDCSDAYVREILLWIMQYEQLNLLRHAIKGGMSSDEVVEIILSKRRMVPYGK